ncbi:MAG: tetratricopeptide repeat protein [Prevotella sp.]|nr:tetratricopeptide repeat protein [Prevotella sp.]
MLDGLASATEALAYRPDSIDLRLRKAGWNVQLEQWEYAKQEYDYVLDREPDNVSALYFRAFVNTKLGRYNFARLDYQNMLAIVPGNFEASLGLALLNQKDRHYTQALDGLNALCDAHPDRSEAFAARAGVESERGMLDLAEYDYGVALQLDPANIDYRVARADLRIRLGRPDEARDDLDELVRRGVSRPALEDFYRRL